MTRAWKVFWPYLITAIAVALFHAAFQAERAFDHWELFKAAGHSFFNRGPIFTDTFVGDEELRVLVASFLVSLLVLAWLRARLGFRLPEEAALSLCAVPFLLGIAFSELPVQLPEMTRGDWHDERRFILWTLIDLRSLGARLSLGLVVAELFLWCRSAPGQAASRWLGKGFLLALPFQVMWVVELQPEYEFTLGQFMRLDLLVPLLALALIPLSLARDTARTPRLIAGLVLASVLSAVLRGQQLTWDALGPHGCGPASETSILDGLIGELYGAAWAEPLIWSPGLVSLAVAIVAFERRGALVVSVVLAAFVAIDAWAVSRYSRVFEFESAPPPASGLGISGYTRDAQMERISFGPINTEATLGRLLARSARQEAVIGCEGELPFVVLEADEPLTEAQRLAITRIAERHHLVVSAGHQPRKIATGSPYVLSSHLHRVVDRHWSGSMILAPEFESRCEKAAVNWAD